MELFKQCVAWFSWTAGSALALTLVVIPVYRYIALCSKERRDKKAHNEYLKTRQKMKNNIACLIGLHQWVDVKKFSRRCEICERREMRVPYSMNNWFKI